MQNVSAEISFEGQRRLVIQNVLAARPARSWIDVVDLFDLEIFRHLGNKCFCHLQSLENVGCSKAIRPSRKETTVVN